MLSDSSVTTETRDFTDLSIRHCNPTIQVGCGQLAHLHASAANTQSYEASWVLCLNVFLPNLKNRTELDLSNITESMWMIPLPFGFHCDLVLMIHSQLSFRKDFTSVSHLLLTTS